MDCGHRLSNIGDEQVLVGEASQANSTDHRHWFRQLPGHQAG
jgi:hypothetical protein